MKGLLDSKLARYVITGGLCFAFEYAVFIGCVYSADLSSGVGQAVSYALGLVANFLLLRWWAFHTEGRDDVKRHLVKYGALVAFNLPVTSLFMSMLVGAGIAAFVAKIIVVAVTALWNFLVYDKLIFKERFSPEDAL